MTQRFNITGGPSRYELMIAQWHHVPGIDLPDRLKFNIQSDFYSKKIIFVDVMKSERVSELGDKWKLEGRYYELPDPIQVREDNPGRNYSMTYYPKTRTGTVELSTD